MKKLLKINVKLDWVAHATRRTRRVEAMFGLEKGSENRLVLYDNFKIRFQPGKIILILGPSGSGKSILIKELLKKIDGSVDLSKIRIPNNRSLVDCFKLPLGKTLKLISLTGLADAQLFVRDTACLSDGQRYRLRLALALVRNPDALVADEFANSLDRLTARVLARHLRKLADKQHIGFILATSHDDLVNDLDPDVLIIKPLGGEPDVSYRDPNHA